MLKIKNFNKKGFTLIELLMVILVIAILAVIAITQFVNYGKDARDAATKTNIQILRRAISEKNAMMRVRCNVQDSLFPPIASINLNNITLPTHDPLDPTTAPCTSGAGGQVPDLADQFFVAIGNAATSAQAIPINPWGPNKTNLVTACTTACAVLDANGLAISDRTASCTGGATHLNADDGWCYNKDTGEVWANSARNDGKDNNSGNEYTF